MLGGGRGYSARHIGIFGPLLAAKGRTAKSKQSFPEGEGNFKKSKKEATNAKSAKEQLAHPGGASPTGPTQFSATRFPFEIPAPIERSTTDLLQALSDTVGEDPTAEHYSYIDDPALRPGSHSKHVLYFMSKEMGKRAARKLVEEWPTLFMFDRDKPRLEAFRPKKALDPQVVLANEENLRTMIRGKHVCDAKELFLRMEAEEKESCSQETLVEFFHLLCYYNEQDPPLDEADWPGLREFTPHMSSVESRAAGRNRMESPENATNIPSLRMERGKRVRGGLVDLLFDWIDPKSREIYSAMICHLCKFSPAISGDEDLERAKALFEEMMSKNLLPSEEVFIHMLDTPLIRSEEERDKLLATAKKWGIKPSIEFYNAQLGNLSSNTKEGAGPMKELVAKMEAEGIEPNLTTYAHLLGIACPTAGDAAGRVSPNKSSLGELGIELFQQLGVNLLSEILSRLEAKPEIVVEQETDINFFHNALKLASYAHNMDLLQRVESLYARPTNRVRLTPVVGETRFYLSYLRFHVRHLRSMEELYRIYERVVPRLTTLDMQLTQLIVQRFHATNTYYWPFVCKLVEDGLGAIGEWNDRTAGDYRRLLHKVDISKLSAEELELYRRVLERLLSTSLAYATIEQERMLKRQVRLPVTSAFEYAELLLRAGLRSRAFGVLATLLSDRALHSTNAMVENDLREENAEQWTRTLLHLFDEALQNGGGGRMVDDALACLLILKHYFPTQSVTQHMGVLLKKVDALTGMNMTFEQRATLYDLEKSCE